MKKISLDDGQLIWTYTSSASVVTQNSTHEILFLLNVLNKELAQKYHHYYYICDLPIQITYENNEYSACQTFNGIHTQIHGTVSYHLIV